jgi:DNA polymerase-3 subunit alpha
MNNRKKPSIPFASLHSHDTFSIFDGLGYPEEHCEFAYKNGLVGYAQTNHGNMNGFGYAFQQAKKMQADGRSDFKIIYGIEAYIHPDIEAWKTDRETHRADAKLAKQINDDVDLVIEDENESKRVIKSSLNQRSHLVLTAQNQEGLNNLFKMVSESYRGDNFYRFPRIDYSLLKRHNTGIIASSACIGGILGNDYWRNRDLGPNAVREAMAKTIEVMMDIFGDRFYGELQWANYAEQHIINQHIIELSKVYGFKLISTCDAHFPNPELWKDREIYKMIGWMGKNDEGNKIDALPKTLEEMEYQLYPKNGDELFASYRDYSSKLGFTYDDRLVEESIARTSDIARNRISDYVPDTGIKLPSFVVPEGETADTALAKVAVEALKKSGLYKDQIYIDRLKEELHTIKDRGFSKYFLTMKTITDKAKANQLCGSGRGSGAGSLVSYLLNITEVNPIKYNLQFSRFIRKTAKDYPDIDFDVSDPMILKEMMINEYGDNTVVPISNFNTLKARSLIKDISKLYDIPFQEVNAVTGKMQFEAKGPAMKDQGLTAGAYEPTWEELKKYSPTLTAYLKKYPDIAIHIENLLGQIRSISRHAGGVLFADGLNNMMPLINSKGVVQTPWTEGQTVRHLEPLGFIKFDILGLTTLRMIQDAITQILKNKHGIKNPTFEEVKAYYDKHLHPESIDLNDQAVYENIFQKGRFLGTFQFTAVGAQNFCVNAKPKNIVDIAAITSIYRPGPLSANVDKKYVDAKNNPESISYIHPLVKEVTENTHGFLVFQEQLSMLAHKLGDNLSLDEGNELRKVLTKKGTGKEAQVKTKLYDKFVIGCELKGIHRDDADELWKKMEFFSGYGFNLSHAICYSIISYQCAWLFHYHPAEWACAFLEAQPEKKKEAGISAVKSYGFKIRQLDINLSGVAWEVSKEDERMLVQPLSSIKGLGDAAISEIMQYRPFNKVEDLLFHDKIKYNKLNKKGLDALIRGGAMTSLMDNRFTGGKHFWSVVAVDRPKTLKKFNENLELYKPEGDFNDEEKIENITALTGTYPIHLVLTEDIRNKLEAKKIRPLGAYSRPPDEDEEEEDIVEIEDEQNILAWFIPRSKEVKKSKGGKDYWFISVTDSTNTLTSLRCFGINPNDVVHMNRPYLGAVSKDGFGFSIRNLKSQLKLLA